VTLGLHLSFAPLAVEHIPQLVGDWLVKNIRADLTQRFVAPRIRLGAPVSEPALCGFPRSRHQSDPRPPCILAIVNSLFRQSSLRRRPLGVLVIGLWRSAGLHRATRPFIKGYGR
jgi:hypothetical protein